MFSLPRAAGVLLLGTTGEIQKYSLESMETACKIMENKLIRPFAFRVHTHALGNFTSSIMKFTFEGREITFPGVIFCICEFEVFSFVFQSEYLLGFRI